MEVKKCPQELLGFAIPEKVIISWTLYSKVKEVNTATRNIEKIYYRVDKKTTS